MVKSDLGLSACVILTLFTIAFVVYALVTNSELDQIRSEIHIGPASTCGSGSVSVCGQGTSAVGQVPVLTNTETSLIGPSRVVIDGKNNDDVNVGALKLKTAGMQVTSLKSADTLASDIVFTMPDTTGLAGQLLYTDGSGTFGFTGVTVGGTNNDDLNLATLNLQSAGSQVTSLKSASTLVSDVALTLPSTAGINGQLLQTDGSGTLAFSGNLIDTVTHIVDVGTATKTLNFNLSGATSGTGTTIQTVQTANRNFILPDVDGLAVVERTTPADFRVIVGSSELNLFGTAKLQVTAYNDPGVFPASLNSAAQVRLNQFGNSLAAPGMGCFKSRGIITNSTVLLAPVLVGDHIMDISATGVTAGATGNGVPLSGFLSFIVSSVPVAPPSFGWIGTDFEVQNVSKNGGINGRRAVFRVSSEGIPQLRESISFQGTSLGQPVAGLATLIAGTVTVANTTLPANARILLTVQPGTAPAGQIYVSAIAANTSFTISSTNAADICPVYYQIWQPIA